MKQQFTITLQVDFSPEVVRCNELGVRAVLESHLPREFRVMEVKEIQPTKNEVN